jgi:hypothetical protein
MRELSITGTIETLILRFLQMQHGMKIKTCSLLVPDARKPATNTEPKSHARFSPENNISKILNSFKKSAC